MTAPLLTWIDGREVRRLAAAGPPEPVRAGHP